jgi:hypothetical protein
MQAGAPAHVYVHTINMIHFLELMYRHAEFLRGNVLEKKHLGARYGESKKPLRWILRRWRLNTEVHATGPGSFPVVVQVLTVLNGRAVLPEVAGRRGGWNWLRIVSKGDSCTDGVEPSCSVTREFVS